MADGLYNIRKANLQKATQVRQAGFKTSIHALPEQVHTRLDQFLTFKMSSMECLRMICAEFPDVKLPSYKAVENYRRRYHIQVLTRQEPAEQDIQVDLKKINIERVVIHELYILVMEILPHLRERTIWALEKEQQLRVPLKMTDDAVKTWLSVIKTMSSILYKNNVGFINSARKTIPAEPEITEERKRELDKKVTRILNGWLKKNNPEAFKAITA